MTNTKALQKYVDDSGLKQEYIAKKLGISSNAFARKRDNFFEFKPTEIDTLCDILHIDTLEERFAIFFAKEVENNSTRKE